MNWTANIYVATSRRRAAQSLIMNIGADSLHRCSLLRLNGITVPVAAFLMSKVGTPFHKYEDITGTIGPLILEALSDLHAIGCTCHGDASYKNVVRVYTAEYPNRVKLLWFNLRAVGFRT